MKIVKIGRTLDNDVALEDDATVSRMHAEIFQDDEGNVFLTDLDSANGTYVNGKAIDGSILVNYNDIIKVGNQVLPWRNFLEEEDLDATIAKQIIIEQEIEELKTPIAYPKNNFLWISVSLIILAVVGIVLFNNLAEEKEARKDPSGIYEGGEDGVEYEFTFSNYSYEKTIFITQPGTTNSCAGNWKTENNGDITVYAIIDNVYLDYSAKNLFEGTYKVCDKPECSEDGKYYKNNNLKIWPQ